MPHYRIYISNERGRLVGAAEFDCADDQQAKERARGGFDGQHVELWRQVPLGPGKSTTVSDQYIPVFRTRGDR